jgi:hypothetical protein
MTHILLKLTIPLIILMTITILLIHTQPHDDSELLTFLSPPDHCPVPCFMGIQAGVTRVSAGQSYLQANPHIQSIKAISLQLYEVDFNENAPSQSARIYFMALPDVTIERVNLFDSGLPFNRFFLTFGTPQRMVVYKTLRPNVVSLVAFYPQYALSIVSNFSLCDLRQITLWNDNRDVAIDVGFWRADSEQPDYYLVATELNIESWAKQLRDMRQERCP